MTGVAMSLETEQRALRILQVPMTALAFADRFWPERADRPPGKRALAGHPVLRRLIASGLARRIEGSSPSADLFVAADAPDAPQPVPMAPPELHVDPTTGEVVELHRRTVGHVAPTQRPPEGDLVVDHATGTVSRVVRQVLGHVPPGAPQAQTPQPAPRMPPQPATQPAAPQPDPLWQFHAWCAARAPEGQAIALLAAEVLYSRRQDGVAIDEGERDELREEAQHRLRALVSEAYSWQLRLGWVAPHAGLERVLGWPSPAAPTSAQPLHRPSYAPARYPRGLLTRSPSKAGLFW